MKYQIFCAIAVIGLMTGCTETRQNMGAAAENDQNVLTGGPVTGTQISDLPQAVRNTLITRAPNGEVADIDRQTRDGQVVYEIQFIEPGTNPTLWISNEGQVLPNSDAEDLE